MTKYFRLPSAIAALHVPTYMQVLRDPIQNLLNYIEKQHMITPLCSLHGDGNLMSLAQKVTNILHEVYITDSEKVGYHVDNEAFTFNGEKTLKTEKAVREMRNKLNALARRHGGILQHEHKLFDDILREVVQPQFQAFWFETPERFFERGPRVIEMPTVLIGRAFNRGVFDLEPEHEEEFKLRIDDAVLEPIDTS